MKKQIPVIFLSVICAGLAGTLFVAHQKIAELEQQLAATDPAPAEQPAEPAVASEPAATPAVPAAPETIVEPIQEAVTEAVAEEQPESSERRMMKSVAKMMENPAMNKMMEASQRGAISSMYEDLMQQFNLTAEEEDYFMDLLMFRQMTQVEAAMKMMGGNLSEEEKEELQSQIQEATKLVKTEMKNFLNNDEDYENFDFFEKTAAERMMLSQAESTLAGTDQALSENTYHDLIEMMHEQKEGFDFTSNLHNADNTDLSAETFSSENMESFKRDQEELNRQILSKAERMLSAEQLNAFKDAINTFTELQNSQLEVAAQMFGGSE